MAASRAQEPSGGRRIAWLDRDPMPRRSGRRGWTGCCAQATTRPMIRRSTGSRIVRAAARQDS